MIRKAENARDPAVKGEIAALRRAAKKALQIGLETGTPVWVMKNGRMVDLTKAHEKPRRKKRTAP